MYRSGPIRDLCHRCSELAAARCQRCHAPLCEAHLADDGARCACCATIARRNAHASIGLGCGLIGALSFVVVGVGWAGGLLGGALVAAAAPSYLATLRFGVEGLFSERWWQAALGLGSLATAALLLSSG
jgi:hypothetical protein